MTDAPKTSPLITDLFTLDRDNPWFGQTVEGIDPPQKKKTKTKDSSQISVASGNPYRAEGGKFGTGGQKTKPAGKRRGGGVEKTLSRLSVSPAGRQPDMAHAKTDAEGWSVAALFRGEALSTRSPNYRYLTGDPNIAASRGDVVYAVKFRPGKTKSIDDVVGGALAPDAAIESEIKRIKASEESSAEKTRYVTFTGWTQGSAEAEATKAVISLYPSQDLKVVKRIARKGAETQVEPVKEEREEPSPERTVEQFAAAFASAGKLAGAAEKKVTEKTAKEKKAWKKSKYQKEDFEKAKISVNASDEEKFAGLWSEKLGDISPQEFKQQFTRGTVAKDTNMNISYYGNRLHISGIIDDFDGRDIGEYQRVMNFDTKTASSALFKIWQRDDQGKGHGKRLLAGNVEMYQQLGIEKVDVHANIDIGGYSWAKYGYVPEQSSWDSLRRRLQTELNVGTTVPLSARYGPAGGTYTPESWDVMSSDEQNDVERAWARETRGEFYDNEETHWHDSGGALSQAKAEMAGDFDSDNDWAREVLNELQGAENENRLRFSTDQILKALTVEYEDRNGDGSDDPTIDFDNRKLVEGPPTLPVLQGQMTLPGIKPVLGHEYLTEDMRDEIHTALTEKFNFLANENEHRQTAPDWISDNIADMQQEYWSGMDDGDRYATAERLGLLPEREKEEEEEEEKKAPPTPEEKLTKTYVEKKEFMDLLTNPDPKTIWKVSDHPMGKRLINKGWDGTLDFKDKQSMDRFWAYVNVPEKKRDKETKTTT